MPLKFDSKESLKLTSKERLVLYGLARYPGLSDIDLATKIGVDRSTIFKSKRKFRDSNLIKLLNVPSGTAVGAEILTVIFVRFRPNMTVDSRQRDSALDSWQRHPFCVFHTSTTTDSVSVLYSRSLTEFKNNFDPLINQYYQMNLVDEVFCSHYPFALTSHSSDASVAVNGIFNLERDDLSEVVLKGNNVPDDESKLTDKDKLTLYAFVKYPMLSDLELSRRTGISRPTISGKRTKFFQNGLLNREAYVDWNKICCELLTFYHLDLRRGASREDLLSTYRSLRRMGEPLFTYLQQGEAFGAFLSTRYSDLKSRVDVEVRTMAGMDLIDKRPMLMVMPLDEIVGAKIDYAPMVADMLGIDREI